MLAYATFVFIGVGLGVSGVLLLAQMNDYGVDRATIGITFFTGSAGFVLASLSNGLLIHRLGVRISLTVGGGVYVLASLCLVARPPFAAFVAVQLADRVWHRGPRVGAQHLPRDAAQRDDAAPL